MCTDLTRECHGANSEQLDVCGLTTSNSCPHDEWPMVKVHILNKGKHSLSCCSSVVMLFCGTRKFPCSANVCFPATVKRKLQHLIQGGEKKKLSFSSALRFPRWQLELQPRIVIPTIHEALSAKQLIHLSDGRDPLLLQQGQNWLFSRGSIENSCGISLQAS